MPATSLEVEKEQFLAKVEKLLHQCEQWIVDADPKAKVSHEETTIEEEEVGSYTAPVLAIERPGYETVRLVPRGRWIIGADGRVDLVSEMERESLIYLPKGKKVSFKDTTDSGKILSQRSAPLVPPEVEGWHYVQSRNLKFHPVLEKELFYRLLEVVGR
jgi:hypothetical protein